MQEINDKKRNWKRKPRRRKKRIPIIALIVMLLSGIGITIECVDGSDVLSKNNVTADSRMEVHFLDMGQSDSTLIVCDGEAMLIDAGDNDQGTRLQLYLKKQGIKSLNYLVLTHPDADHIGGADVVITKFDIGTVFMSDYEKTTRTYTDLLDTLKYKGYQWITPKVGNTYTLGSAKITIAGPIYRYEYPNNSSIVLMIEHGNNKFLFTGDAEEEAEQALLYGDVDLNADVLKVGHHGSKTSSIEAFLDEVSPESAVISCGIDNSYGFPHAKTLNNLRARGVDVYRTDNQGTVVAVSDGNQITWNCSPDTTWQVGERHGK